MYYVIKVLIIINKIEINWKRINILFIQYQSLKTKNAANDFCNQGFVSKQKKKLKMVYLLVLFLVKKR